MLWLNLFNYGFLDILSRMTCLIKEIVRSIDFFYVAIYMSGLVIMMMMMMMNHHSNSNLLYNTVNYGDLTNKNIGRKQGFRLIESVQGIR